MSNSVGVLLVVGIFAAIIIYSVWERLAYRTHVKRARTAWQRSKTTVHFEPLAAYHYGDEPLTSYAAVAPKFGALGLADGKLIFTWSSQFTDDYAVAFDTIEWVGFREITVKSGKYTRQEHALIVHYESAGLRQPIWHVAAFTFAQFDNPGSATLLDLARALAKQIDQEVHMYQEGHGPVTATRMNQDVYGAWTHDYAGELYAAPDRLLFNLRDAIHFAELRRVDVYEKGGLLDKLNPFSEDLLRIEYTVDGEHHTTGFLVRHAEVWAEVLRHRTRVPVEVHAGRKKKPD